MADLCFLCEKGTQMGKYAKAFGGNSGTVCGQTYKLCHSRGHLLTLVSPQNMVNAKNDGNYKVDQKKLASWSDMDALPWDWKKFNWHKKYIKQSYKTQYANRIARTASQCKAIVIATDNDPDKEGDLLGWEIVNAIGWKGPVYRVRPQDLSRKSLVYAVKHKVDITDQMHQGEYLEAMARQRFDYLAGLPLTRIPTHYARKAGYNVPVSNEGRLKSVILVKIFRELEAIKNYHKTPYYEVRYKDSLGNIYKRKVEKGEHPKFRHVNDEAAGKTDLANYQPAKVANVKIQTKRQQPPKMLSLDELGTILSKHGCYPKQFSNLYESMYMDSYVSYPRTADTGITKEQFKSLLAKSDQIADLLGVDKKLLTHRTLRKKHYTAHADHGANRPGDNVPSSLKALDDKFHTKYASMIYKILAKSFLTILCEDYVYKRVSATPEGHDDFKGSFNMPVKYNFKELTGKPKKDKDVDIDKWKSGTMKPFLFQGSNPKPTWPSQKWMVSYLKKKGVGTGATRNNVFKILVGHGKRVGKNVRILSNRGRFTLNRSGKICAIMALNTMISRTDVTDALGSIMESVCSFKHTWQDVCHMATVVVEHDKPIMKDNVKLLGKYGISKGSSNMQKKSKVEVNLNGSPVKISDTWGGHKFTKDELAKMSRGEEITFQGKFGKVTGKLGKGSFKGSDGKTHKYIGFIKVDNKYHGTWKGHSVSLKKTWGKHSITPEEFKKLCAGQSLTFNEYSFPVKLDHRVYKFGKKKYKKIGIKPMFQDN